MEWFQPSNDSEEADYHPKSCVLVPRRSEKEKFFIVSASPVGVWKSCILANECNELPVSISILMVVDNTVIFFAIPPTAAGRGPLDSFGDWVSGLVSNQCNIEHAHSLCWRKHDEIKNERVCWT